MRELLQKIQPGFLSKHFEKLSVYTDNILKASGKDLRDISQIVQFIPIAYQQIAHDIFAALGKAIFHVKQIRVVYRDIKGTISERTISIQRLVYYRDHWYLDAWCH